jgi:hypothetical protein
MVHDADLFILQIHTSSFETEVVQHRVAFHWLGSRMSQSLILIDDMSSAFGVKKKKEEK